jgi:hypothetical protein
MTRSLFSWLRGGSGRKLTRRRSFVPRLLVLEDRSLPSTFLVSNLADSGAGSLRQAILDANADSSPDLILFAPDVHGTIALSSGQLEVANNLTIVGPGAAQLAVSGNDQSRVFAIDPGITVAIDDLTITHGLADNGGAILNSGATLSLSYVVVADSEALGAPGSTALGGGVFNDGGTLFVSQSTFSDDRAIGGVGGSGIAGGVGGGGGIESLNATLIVTGSMFSGNQAIGGAGGSGAAGGLGVGGAIRSHMASSATISHCIFADNQALVQRHS